MVAHIQEQYERNVELNKDNLSKVRLRWGRVNDEDVILYDYTAFQRKLASKCAKAFIPLSRNRIRRRIMNYGVDDSKQEQIVFQAISRMAFERDPKKQIQVVLLDYNSLDEF